MSLLTICIIQYRWQSTEKPEKPVRQKNLHYWHHVSRQKTSAGSSFEEEIEKGRDGFSVIRRHHYHKMKGQKRCAMITNAFVPEIVETVNRYGKTKDKPNVVDVYNQNMSGIDRSDQMLSYHSGLWKTIRWYKKVGVHIMEILLANAFYLYFKLTPSPKVKPMRKFKECVIRNLIGKPKPKKHMVPQASFHYLAPIPSTEKKKNPCRCCKHYSSNGKRKET